MPPLSKLCLMLPSIYNSCRNNVSKFKHFTSITGNGVAWELPSKFKDSIGSRSLIIAANDNHSQELSKHMWFEMQKVGIQGQFCTMRTTYPTIIEIESAVETCIRTAPTSIVSIGNQQVCDFAKGVQALLNTSNSSISSFDNRSSKDIGNISLFTVGSVRSASLYSNTWDCLHVEEDALVTRLSSLEHVVVFDDSVALEQIEYADYQAHLIDTAFSHAYHHTLLGITEEQCCQVFEDALQCKNVRQEKGKCPGSWLGALRRQLQLSAPPELACHPVLSVASVSCLHWQISRGVTRPLSWEQARLADDVLQMMQSVAVADEMTTMQRSCALTLRLLQSATSETLPNYRHITARSKELIEREYANNKSKYVTTQRKKAGNPNGAAPSSLSPAALLEGAITAAENHVTFAVKTKHPINAIRFEHNKLEFLKSDMMLDLLDTCVPKHN